MNERAIGVNQFLARIPNPLSKSLNNKFNLVLRVFWCVLFMASTVTIPYKEIIEPITTKKSSHVEVISSWYDFSK